MSNFRAPGIQFKEIDLSDPVIPQSTSVGAMVGPSHKGPTNRRVLVTSNTEFFQTFGTPISGVDSEFTYYAAEEFLKESGFLYFVRTTTSADTVGALEYTMTTADLSDTATSSFAPESCAFSEGETKDVFLEAGFEDGNKPDNYYPVETSANAGAGITIAANSCGEWSKNIGVSVITPASSATTSALGFDYGYNWDGKFPPEFTYYRINVYFKNDNISESEAGWVPGSSAISGLIPDETYIVSNDPLARDFNGNSMYVKDVINGKSKYIYTVPGTDTNFLSKDLSVNGIISLVPGDAEINTNPIVDGWDLFKDKDKSLPNILIAPYASGSNTNYTNARLAVAEIAASRKDCLAVINVGDLKSTPQEIVNARSNAAFNSSYVALYCGWDKIFDRYSSRNVYVPKSIFAAAIIARNDNLANPWNAPAGLARGNIGSLDQYRVFNEEEIGFMYNANINTSKRVRSIGDVMWGQKTGQLKASALDRINVRRLLTYIQNSIEPTLLNYLFEQNTPRLRTRVKSNIDDFLATVLAGGGLSAYEVISDESNNTPDSIDRNELAIDIFVQPTKTVEFINVRTIITRTGVSFSEV